MLKKIARYILRKELIQLDQEQSRRVRDLQRRFDPRVIEQAYDLGAKYVAAEWIGRKVANDIMSTRFAVDRGGSF
jgi:hypothetical protein